MNIRKFNTKPKTIHWRPLQVGKISGSKSKFHYLGKI